jgi:hypothetical protein
MPDSPGLSKKRTKTLFELDFVRFAFFALGKFDRYADSDFAGCALRCPFSNHLQSFHKLSRSTGEPLSQMPNRLSKFISVCILSLFCHQTLLSIFSKMLNVRKGLRWLALS